MTEIHQLYAETAKPSWAGGTYNSEKLTEGQSFELVVFADPRSSGEGTYTTLLQSAPCTSQP